MTPVGEYWLSASRGLRRAVRWRPAAALLASCLLFIYPGCGYRFQADPGFRFADPSLRMDLRSFANASLVPDAGAILASRLREELRRIGFRGSFEQMASDYTIEGTVKEIREDVFTRGTDGRALEHRLTLVVDIRVVEMARGRPVWKENGLSETASYFAGADFQYTESNRRAAVEELSRRMARRIGQTIRLIL